MSVPEDSTITILNHVMQLDFTRIGGLPRDKLHEVLENFGKWINDLLKDDKTFTGSEVQCTPTTTIVTHSGGKDRFFTWEILKRASVETRFRFTRPKSLQETRDFYVVMWKAARDFQAEFTHPFGEGDPFGRGDFVPST